MEFKEGIFNLEDGEYREMYKECLSQSALKLLYKSGFDYKHRYIDKNETFTKSKNLGTAVHACILEPKLFQEKFIISECKYKSGKKFEAYHEELKEKGLIALTEEEFKICEDIENIFNNEKINWDGEEKILIDFFTGGKAEQSFFLIDEESGQKLCGKADYINEDEGFVVDLKTTKDASESFCREISNYDYQIQAALTLDCLNKIGVHIDHFVFVAIEPFAPYNFGVYTLCNDSIDFGRFQYKKGIETYQKAIKQNKFKSYNDRVKSLKLPVYKIGK